MRARFLRLALVPVAALALVFTACGSRTGLLGDDTLADGGDGGLALGDDSPFIDDIPFPVDVATATVDAPPPPPDGPPRPVAPLSTSRVTTRQPTLHWALPAGFDAVTVDLCFDRACTKPIQDPTHVIGSAYAVPEDLPVGVVFWRLHPGTDLNVSGPTWQFTVGAGSAPVDSSWGTTLDVNGDGFADVVVGAPQLADTGAAYVYLGSATGLATTAAATLVGPEGSFGEFGWSVASAGDVNGDGFADLVVAVRGVGGPGCIYVYPGGAAGVGTSPLAIPCPTGTGLSEDLSVASAGDVNGDGYADVVLGGTTAGAAFVYLGSASGLSTTPAVSLTGPTDAGIGSANVAVAGAGDVNGDGFGDVIVSGFEGNWGEAGGIFVYLGSSNGLVATPATVLPGATQTGPGSFEFDTSVACAGDVNGDGYADVFVGACGAEGSACVHLGSAAGVVSTPAVVLSPGGTVGVGASAGDVNGDGYGDLALGSMSNQGLQSVYVYLGSASGLGAAPAVVPGEPNQTVDSFGIAFASAGDVDGDGFSDLVVGAADGTPSGGPDDTGSAYIYLGGDAGLASTPAMSLVGAAGQNGWFGSSVFGASD